MTTVHHLLADKGAGTETVHSSTRLIHALRRMRDLGIGSLVVMDGDRVVGLLTERQLVRCSAELGASCIDGRVGDVMEREVAFVSVETSIDDCMALMTELRTRHLPVLDDTELIGIVSIGDVVKTLIADREFEIEQLERYIMGG